MYVFIGWAGEASDILLIKGNETKFSFVCDYGSELTFWIDFNKFFHTESTVQNFGRVP